MSNLRIEARENGFYVYGTLESGNCICLGVYETENRAREELAALVALDEKEAA